MDFVWIWGLYTATYIAANGIDTVCNYNKVDSTYPKFVGTTAVNMPFCVLKDRAFTRMFGMLQHVKCRLNYRITIWLSQESIAAKTLYWVGPAATYIDLNHILLQLALP